MKHIGKVLTLLALAFLVAVPAANASTVAEAKAAIAELRSLTQTLPVTKPSQEAAIRSDLTKKLDEATRKLDEGLAQTNEAARNKKYYEAAKKVYDYAVKLWGHRNKGRVAEAEAQVLIDKAVLTIDCIVSIYCPDCDYP